MKLTYRKWKQKQFASKIENDEVLTMLVFFFADRDSYEWVLPENSPDFPIPFFVYADDDDENGTQNAEVRWLIVVVVDVIDFVVVFVVDW